MTFHWNGQGGYPSWYWGGSDGTNMYVYNPLNLPFLRNDVASILMGGSRFLFDNALAFGHGTFDQYTSLIFKSSAGEVSTTPKEYVYPMIVRMDQRHGESDLMIGSYSSAVTQYAPIYSIHPRVSSHYYVGDTSAPFAGFNSMTALKIISDKRKKKNLVKIDEWYHPLKNFLKELAPYWYQLVSQVDDAVHMGFLAQEVEELMKKYNIPEKWSLLNKTQKRDDDGNFIDDYNYSLCYEQFIPLLLFVLQKEVLELPKS